MLDDLVGNDQEVLHPSSSLNDATCLLQPFYHKLF